MAIQCDSCALHAAYKCLHTNTHSEYVIIIALPPQYVCRNAPQYYVMRMLPVLFYFIYTVRHLHVSVTLSWPKHVAGTLGM